MQEDDSITITISATTPADTWVGIGVSDDQMMVSDMNEEYVCALVYSTAFVDSKAYYVLDQYWKF